MIVRSIKLEGIFISEVQTDKGSVNISKSFSKSIVGRVTPGLAIKYVEFGREDYQLEKTNLSISKGRFFLLRNDVYFKGSITSKNTTKGCCVNLEVGDINFIDSILENDLLFEIPFGTIHSSELGKTLHRFACDGNITPEQIASNIPNLSLAVHSFSQEISELSERLSPIHKKKVTTKSIITALTLAKEYIYRNYKNKILLDDLAKISGISKFHLTRLFSRCFKITPLQLQQKLRIEKATEMIKSQSLSLSNIAFSLGYPDLASFSKCFKNKYGVPPSRYLKNLF